MYSDSDYDDEFDQEFFQRSPSTPVRRRRQDILPKICYQNKTACAQFGCRGLHICQLFLAGICNFGANCQRGHSLTTPHNAILCRRYGLDPRKEWVLVQLATQESNAVPEETYRRHLEVCFKYKSPDRPCGDQVCYRLHFCRRFITGTCVYDGEACRFGHDLHTTHNHEVLSRHKVSALPDRDIMAILRTKYRGNERQAAGDGAGAAPRDPLPRRGTAQQAPPAAPDRTAQRAAVPSAPPGEDTLQASGIAEELRCPVCLGLLQRATTLGCGHSFCAECVAGVQRQDPKCPVCRTYITHSSPSVMLDNIISSMAKVNINTE